MSSSTPIPPRIKPADLLRRTRQLQHLCTLIRREVSEGNLELAADMATQGENEANKLVKFGGLEPNALGDEIALFTAAKAMADHDQTTEHSDDPSDAAGADAGSAADSDHDVADDSGYVEMAEAGSGRNTRVAAAGTTGTCTIAISATSADKHRLFKTSKKSKPGSGAGAAAKNTLPVPRRAQQDRTPRYDATGYPVSALHTFNIPGLALTDTPGEYTATSYRGKKVLRFHVASGRFKLRMQRGLSEEEKRAERRRCSRCGRLKLREEMREGRKECLRCWQRPGREGRGKAAR